MRASREHSLGLRIGDTLIHANDEFTIIDIRREENAEGMRLSIYAADPDQASKLQELTIKHDQLSEQGTDLLSQLAEKLRKGIKGGSMGDMGI